MSSSSFKVSCCRVSGFKASRFTRVRVLSCAGFTAWSLRRAKSAVIFQIIEDWGLFSAKRRSNLRIAIAHVFLLQLLSSMLRSSAQLRYPGGGQHIVHTHTLVAHFSRTLVNTLHPQTQVELQTGTFLPSIQGKMSQAIWRQNRSQAKIEKKKKKSQVTTKNSHKRR